MSVTLYIDEASRTGNPDVCPTRALAARVEREIEAFLKSVEKRAFRIAVLSLRQPDDALDVVQEAMLQLVRHYGTRPAEEWPPLFHRILRNRIRDAQRRRRTRNRFVAWWVGGVSDEDDAPDPIESAVSETPTPVDALAQAQSMGALTQAMQSLPERQRAAFVLRALEGLDVAQTAQAMGCSEGSVKTHYFRALTQLRVVLGEHRQ